MFEKSKYKALNLPQSIPFDNQAVRAVNVYLHRGFIPRACVTSVREQDLSFTNFEKLNWSNIILSEIDQGRGRTF